ncbi:unnamed protein product, partial [Medioppia subpectinata]
MSIFTLVISDHNSITYNNVNNGSILTVRYINHYFFIFLPLFYLFVHFNQFLRLIQMTGESRVESYQSALTRGCRCIDLEVVDGDNGEPIVCHGLSATILLRDVLQTIQKYAFKTTQYPLILSMEIHCSFEQQIVIASLIRQILKDYLYDGVVDNNKSHLPSPEAL